MFTHLHLHTQYSLSQGAIRIKPLVAALQEQGASACAITDHGNMFGVVEFHHTLRGAGLKPILGMGVWVLEGSLEDAHKAGGRPQGYPLQLLCENREGYHNLCYLASLSHTEGKLRGLPYLDRALLEQHRSGLIALSGGPQGEVAERLSQERTEEARQTAQWLNDVYNGQFYLELQNTGDPEHPACNERLLGLAKELDLPVVATNDCHYLKRDEAEAQHILWLMGRQKRVSDDNAPKAPPAERYLKTEAELRDRLPEVPAVAFSNTQMIADRCNVDLANDQYFLPKFEVPESHTLDSWLEHESKSGLEKRLAVLFGQYRPEESFEEFRKSYDERLAYELEVIISMRFPGYFLIVADFINWAKDNGVPVGPGRGSGAGSLVAYSLRITDVDPLHYGLLFERFLNPDRISMPDFDIDFDVAGRDRVIEYVRQHYGQQNVCQISTFNSLKAKAAVRGVARVLDFPYSEADKIAKLIPNELNITIDEALDKEPELARMAREGSPNEQKLIDLSLKLEGLSTHLGTHAAGVIIMDQDIREVMPVCTGRDGELQSMYTMKWAEDQGAVKFDFLGLLNLTNIEQTLALVNKDRSEEDRLDLDRIPMDDPLTFQLYCEAKTTGVFQLESSGTKRLLRDMQPSSFEDIVSILALYRPGPLGSGMVDDFVMCKNGRKPVTFSHPLLAPLLHETYGVMVYQEQIMQIVQVLAGFTLGQSDLLRRAIGKKIPEVLEEQRSKFVEGCLANPEFVSECPQKTTPKEKANEIFDLIHYFSGYGFNKSHTVAYGLISYHTAYLKAHYPVECLAALLNGAIGSPDSVVNYISECKEMGIRVLPPDVNDSEKEFTVTPEPDKAVRFGLNAVKNVGGPAVDAILEVRSAAGRLTDFLEFLKAVDLTRVNKRTLETLIQSGAFDSIHENRAQLMSVYEEALHLAQEHQRHHVENQHSLFELLDESEAKATETRLEFPDLKEWRMQEKLRHEKAALGFYVSGHPLDRFQSETQSLTTTTTEVRDGAHPEQAQVVLAGIVTDTTVRLNRDSEKFAIIRFEDLRGSLELPVYARVYAQCGPLLEEDDPVLIRGRIVMRDDEPALIPDAVQRLDEVREQFAERLTLHLLPDALDAEQYRRLNGTLQKYSGEQRVEIRACPSTEAEVRIQLPHALSFTAGLSEELEELLPVDKLEYAYSKSGRWGKRGEA
ncbi:MAG: DNA polymerase III subunit alpha [SAR324 cluster bacterium]|nr:DNA polymerase III subunit alpha [SAR324 cluster bacterium]